MNRPVAGRVDWSARRLEWRWLQSGGVAEWSNAPVLKTGVAATSPWVRIPPPPLDREPLMALASLDRRERQPETMDQPGLDPVQHAAALRGLARINFVSRSASILWPELAVFARHCNRSIRILDLACGGGDVTAALRRRAAKARLPVVVEGCDISATAVNVAKANGGGRVFQLDVLRTSLPEGYDATVCSLFLHHLHDDDAVELLRKMAAASQLVLVNDLSRGGMGLLLAHLACRVLTRSDVVRMDAPISVRAAFTPDEAMALATRAGLEGATVRSAWPCRFLLTWHRAGGSP